jgi:SAM-dependent methyltransferase/UDP-N-acetylglucosamine transferase subunit ALG13
MDILVTVGMGPRPFDRLLRGVIPLCDKHRVFAQTGTSRVALPCANAPFVPREELLQRIQRADVVITHAGNTARLVQRAHKVPIAVARTAAAGEMPNDHQVEYLRFEEGIGRIVAVWDVADLPHAVAEHPSRQAQLLAERPLPGAPETTHLVEVLEREMQALVVNPFRRHMVRRYSYAWRELYGRTGRHLDVGCNTGEFVGRLSETTVLECYAVDPHDGYLRELADRYPRVRALRVAPDDRLPYPDAWFASVSLLDVLEHCRSEVAILSEIRRVLQPGGILVLSVPARHVFSWMDPDNIKVRFPRLHRRLYSLRFGRDLYHDRFVDTSNGLWGEMSVGRREHTNYRRDRVAQLLHERGFKVFRTSGANLFWRWFQIPALLGPGPLRPVFERAIWLDGALFDRANFFVTARRTA